MAKESSAIIGSGTIPFTRAILPELQLGANNDAEGVRHGTNVIVSNPEDLLASAAFASSGITVGTSPVEILSPGTNPLPRASKVILQNLGAADVYIGHGTGIILPVEGFELTTPSSNEINIVELSLLHNVSIWAQTAAGTADVRMLILL